MCAGCEQEYINVRFQSKLKTPIPAELLLIILTTVVSHFGGLHQRFALPVIGHIARGLPAPSVPAHDGGRQLRRRRLGLGRRRVRHRRDDGESDG